MSISIFRKIYIYRTAMKDSKGAYSSYLEQWHTEKDHRAAFCLSAYMSRLVISYSKKCERKLFHTGHLQRLYTRILKQCGILDEQLNQHDDQVKVLQDKIHRIDDKMQKHQQEVAVLNKTWNHALETGNLPPDAGVSTVKELITLMEETDVKIQELAAEEEKLTEIVRTMQNNLNTDILTAFNRLERLVLSYQNRIRYLHRDLAAYATRQDESLVYYWYVLGEQMNKHLRQAAYKYSKSFRQICQIRGVYLIKEEELFAKEREEINRRTSHYKNFSMKV